MVEGNGSTSERGNMQVGEESNTYDKTQEVFFRPNIESQDSVATYESLRTELTEVILYDRI